MAVRRVAFVAASLLALLQTALPAALTAGAFLEAMCVLGDMGALCSLPERVVLLQQQPANVRLTTLTGTTVVAGAPPGGAVMDISASNASSSRPLLALGANATLLLRDLDLDGAALVLPSPQWVPLPLAQLLALRAVQLPTGPSSGGAQLVLQNVRITTPSCVALSMHQAAACRALAPSQDLTVAPGLLWLGKWSSATLTAVNVTLTCSGPPAPHACVAVAVGSGQELVDVLYGTYGVPTAAAAPPTFIMMTRDITLAAAIVPVAPCAAQGPGPPPSNVTSVRKPAFPPTQPGPCAVPITAAGSLFTPITITSLLLISGGSVTLPSSDSAVRGAASSTAGSSNNSTPVPRAFVLDLGGAPYLLDVTSDDCIQPACRVELHNLSLSGMPLGPPTTYPLGLLRGLIWTFKARHNVVGGSQGRLLVRNISLLLDPEEVAVWIYSTAQLGALVTSAAPLAPAAASSEPQQGTQPVSLPTAGAAVETGAITRLTSGSCASWTLFNPQGRLVPSMPDGHPGLHLDSLVSNSARYQDVLLTSALNGDAGGSAAVSSGPAPYTATPCGFSLWPIGGYGCGLEDGSGSVTCSGGNDDGRSTGQHGGEGEGGGGCFPIPVQEAADGSGSLAVGSTSARPFAAACHFQPWGSGDGGSGDTREATALATSVQTERGGYLGPHALSWVNYLGQDLETPLRKVLLVDSSMAGGGPRDSYDNVQASISQPGVVLGDPAGPRLLNLSRLPALINLRGPLAALTLRDLVLVAAPTAGLHPAALPVLALRAKQDAEALAGASVGLDPTGGLPPGLANFTSCLWTLDFDRRAGTEASSVEAPAPWPMPTPAEGAEGSSAPRTPPDDVGVLLALPPQPPLPPLWWHYLPKGSPRPRGLPRATLDSVILLVPYRELQLMAWCMAHNNTAPLSDLGVAGEVAAMLAASQLVAPGLVRRQLAEAEAMGYGWGPGGGGEGGATGASPQPSTPSPLRSITFWLFSWCGLYGRNITLASKLPYASAAPYMAAASSALELPESWDFLAASMPLPPVPAASAINDADGGASIPSAAAASTDSSPIAAATAANAAVATTTLARHVQLQLVKLHVSFRLKQDEAGGFHPDPLASWTAQQQETKQRREEQQQAAAAALVITGELGRGAQGVVYSGRWRGLEVAIKSILLTTGGQDRGAPVDSTSSHGGYSPAAIATAAAREAAITTSMAHPNLVACYTSDLTPLQEQPPEGGPGWDADKKLGSMEFVDSVPDAWRLTLVLERCNGGSLRSFLAAGWGTALAAMASTLPAGAVPAHTANATPQWTAGTQAGSTWEVAPPRPPQQPLLPRAAVARLALDVARGMAHLHSHGVAHGDLSSANVLLHLQQQLPHSIGDNCWAPVILPMAAGLQPQLLERLVAKVCDFGLSQRMGRGGAGNGMGDEETHVTGHCRRSSAYSAPELVRLGHTGYKQDVYAYGVLVWELAAGLPLPELLLRPAGRRVCEWLRAQAGPGVLAQALPPALLEWPPWSYAGEGGPHMGSGSSPPSEQLWWSRVAELAAQCLREQPAGRPSFAQLCIHLEKLLAAAAE
ncbi:Receptor-like protein kinase FERONIA [Tetrabaena socialis]|uniref:Receptor-like protein kinase FERONIA n=1 Tax=Tetrabaena socialis TaxID=47790 RepID=A0A2J7ZU54_9CHLO|nr:Receptor-like protein kinase FERONIA [Tetrabaena socialis]|eukprot:PNH03805.1 Receptor-like protein kinase FERONIA [Tetrabaena socialis]